MVNQIALPVVFLLLAPNLMNIAGLSIRNQEDNEQAESLKNLEEFLKLVEKYNLNMSIVASHLKYSPTTRQLNEAISLSWRLNANKDFRTVASLDSCIQKEYLDKWEDVAMKSGLGVKSRIIKVHDGKGVVLNSSSLNLNYIINSPAYDILTKFPNGVSELHLIGNSTGQALYNFVVDKPTSNGVKTVQVLSSKVHIKELSVSDQFPDIVLEEIKKVLPKLYLSIESEEILATLLSDHLEREFDNFFQVVIGFDTFTVGRKPFANLDLGNTNILVFIS